MSESALRVLLVGASSQIGRAITRTLVRDGASVVGVSLEAVNDEQLAGDLVADCSKAEPARAAVATAVECLGGLDALVVAAGAMVTRRIEQTDESDWQIVAQANILAALYPISAAAPLICDGGSIVAVTSINASRPAPWVSAYAAAKAAVEGLVRGLAVDLAPRGIRVNAVAPGLASGARIPDPGATGYLRGYAITPEEVAEAIVFLASPRASGVSGCVLPVDAAFHVLPATALSRPDLMSRVLPTKDSGG